MLITMWKTYLNVEVNDITGVKMEKALKRLNDYCYSLEAINSIKLEIDGINTQLENVRSSSKFDITPPSVTNYIIDDKDELLDKKICYEKQLHIIEKRNKGVEYALNCLDEEDRDMLVVMLIDRSDCGKEYLMDKYFLSERTFYRKFNKAKEHFSKYWCGE